LKKADEQYSRTIWEYESKETAIHVERDLLKKDNNADDLYMPIGKERLYRKVNMSIGEGGKEIDVFSPDIRDTSMFNGLNELIRQIEFLCGLAYGTLSKEIETAKTATEIKTSKQRSYQMVKDIQKSLQIALEGLIYAMQVWGQITQLGVKAVNLESDVSYNFDDSIIVDKESEMQKLFLYVTSGILKPEYLLKKEGFSEDDIKNYMQEQTIVKGDPFANNQE
jgi:A118 family predicted phage portal protein